MHQNKVLRLLRPLVGIILIAILLKLVFIENIFGSPMPPLPFDQNRENNFRANPNAWMVDDRLHLSYRHKTLQVGDSGRFRRMNGKRTIATATDDYYLYGYTDPDSAMFDDLRLVRRSDGVEVFRSKECYGSYLNSTYLYYVEPPFRNCVLKRYSLADGTIEEMLPNMSVYCIVGDDILYTTDGFEDDESNNYDDGDYSAIRYKNLQTGEDIMILSRREFPYGVGAFFVDDGKIYFPYMDNIQCFDPNSKTLSVFLEDDDISLRNAYNGKLYFDRITEGDGRYYTHELFVHDIETGERTVLQTYEKVYDSEPIDITVLDDKTIIYGMWLSKYYYYLDNKKIILG